jgi:DNA helicase-2/ATP-dependent DNA helicase PcrA
LENAVREYMGRVTTPTIAGFLDEISLYTDRVEEKADRELGVNLMTLHSSKGLEFDCVYVCGLEEGLFPSQRAIEENTVEEERRLFYVGMTRARLYLHILFAHQRMSYGVLQPRLTSRFLDELPQEGVIQRGMEMRRPRATAQWDEVAQVSTHEGEESHVSYDDGVPAFQKGDDRRFKLVSELTGTQRRYRKGLKVRHSEYGIGIIRKCEGNPGHERLVVAFEYFGERKFMAQYAQLEVLGK